MDLEKIINDLEGISVFRYHDKVVSHIKDTKEYPKEEINDVIYNSYTSREWSSDDSVPGGGAGDWYESEIITNEYMFLENNSGAFKEIVCMGINYPSMNLGIVKDVKKALEDKGHKIGYIIKRETVDGPNWGWFNDIVYIVKGE